MTIIKDTFDQLRCDHPITLTIGNFDGIHAGHQQLIERLMLYPDTKHALMTFDPHPAKVLRKKDIRTLTSTADKIELLGAYVLDDVFIVTFDEAFSKMSSKTFIEGLKALNVKRLILGRDARFGYQGEGSVDALADEFEVVVVDDMLYNHTRVSTTYIKDLIHEGDIQTARKLLNRHYVIKGVVVHGNAVGRKLGFPTANIDYMSYVIPKNGVYYVKVQVDHVWYSAMANIGNNPTLNYSSNRRLEVYILDFDEALYGKTVDVAFFAYLRPEMKFSGRKALIEQLQKDESTIRKLTI